MTNEPLTVPTKHMTPQQIEFRSRMFLKVAEREKRKQIEEDRKKTRSETVENKIEEIKSKTAHLQGLPLPSGGKTAISFNKDSVSLIIYGGDCLGWAQVRNHTDTEAIVTIDQNPITVEKLVELWEKIIEERI